MDIAFCFEHVVPRRGGCETYIADLSRWLVGDGHRVHLYACQWDEAALPREMHFHRLLRLRGPRFLRPWRFGRQCLAALRDAAHDVTVGFDKTWGLDVLYPLGGLHSALAEQNLRKHGGPLLRGLARLSRLFDLAHHNYTRLERYQYLGGHGSQIVVNSELVRGHFAHHLGIPAERIRVVRSAIDPGRFPLAQAPRLRQLGRDRWGFGTSEVVGLFVARNHRLKGLAPLLHAAARSPSERLRLLICGSDQVGSYQRLAQRLGIAGRVVFGGSCPDIETAYFAADFLVHPTFYDPCSLVVLEAMACGLPAITTRYNGASELMHPPDDGLVVGDPHDHAALATALGQMCDPDFRRAAALAARRAASQWTFEHHYRHLLDVFAEVSRRKQAA